MCEQVTGDSQTANCFQTEQNDNLKRLFKNRRRDESVVKTAKTLLVHGYAPGRVALILRLDPEFVGELAKTWNPRFRRVKHTSQHATGVTVRQYFESGAMLENICVDLQLPLFTVVRYLSNESIPRAEIMARFPEETDPLVIEYRKTLSRHAHRKQKAPRLH
ncbi:hypothetical protein UD636_09220 [Citrobacter braakii]|nr:hypothetical protein [Citrobacter freundii]HEF0013332.1 hypothetical protein [Citrobacter freundii]